MGFLTNIWRPGSPVPSGHLAVLLAVQRSLNPIQSGLRGISLWQEVLWWQRSSAELVGDTEPKRQHCWRHSPQTLALPSLGSPDRAKGRGGRAEILPKSLPLSLLGGSEKTKQSHGQGEQSQDLWSQRGMALLPPTLQGMGTSSLFKSINVKDCNGCWRQQHWLTGRSLQRGLADTLEVFYGASATSQSSLLYPHTLFVLLWLYREPLMGVTL